VRFRDSIGEHSWFVEWPSGIESDISDDPNVKKTKESRFADLPVVTRDDPQFRNSLTLSVHVGKGELLFAQKSSQSYIFKDSNRKKIVTIESVMAMLSVSTNFGCERGRDCVNGSHFTFVVYCTKCETDSSIKIHCPCGAVNLFVTSSHEEDRGVW
jgi:hypothetical protein